METDENCYYYIDNCRQEIEIREKRFISLEGLTRSIFLVDLQMCREFRWTIPEMIHWHYYATLIPFRIQSISEQYPTKTHSKGALTCIRLYAVIVYFVEIKDRVSIHF